MPGQYQARFEVRLHTDPARLRALLTDYDRLPRLSLLITESRRLPGDDPVRVHQTWRVCALFLCRTVRRRLTVETAPDGVILTRVDPAQSDFHHGEETWQILPDEAGARLRYRLRFSPAFFVPPLLGPWILENRLREEFETFAHRLETLDPNAN